MSITFIHYPKCTTCQKAKKWLTENNLQVEERDIKENNPTYEELKKLFEKSDYPIKRFFNTSGLIYKSLGLKDRLASMSTEEQLTLLATDGMLVKRPIIETDEAVLVGFKLPEWEKCFNSK